MRSFRERWSLTLGAASLLVALVAPSRAHAQDGYGCGASNSGLDAKGNLPPCPMIDASTGHITINNLKPNSYYSLEQTMIYKYPDGASGSTEDPLDFTDNGRTITARTYFYQDPESDGHANLGWNGIQAPGIDPYYLDPEESTFTPIESTQRYTLYENVPGTDDTQIAHALVMYPDTDAENSNNIDD